MVDAEFVGDLALFDFSKAFDLLSHIILTKLGGLGVCLVLVGWVHSFSLGRSMGRSRPSLFFLFLSTELEK